MNKIIYLSCLHGVLGLHAENPRKLKTSGKGIKPGASQSQDTEIFVGSSWKAADARIGQPLGYNWEIGTVVYGLTNENWEKVQFSQQR